MTRRLKVPFSLSRKRIRASLSKYNVYNAMTWRKNRPLSTQFRQVFFAKQESRSYHGDRLTENQFKNHFRGDLPVVSPLQSSGKRDDARDPGEAEDIPYALQTFVGLERRLDFAVFRAMFSSSVRQAAFFVLRGSVKVNGVRVRSPGYILKQGDMFSVDPRRVLFALGRPKPSLAEAIRRTNRSIAKFNQYIDRCHKHPERMFHQRQKNRKRHHVFHERRSAASLRRAEETNVNVRREMNEKVRAVKPQQILESILLGTFKPQQPEVSGTLREIGRLVGLSGTNSAPKSNAAPTESKLTESAANEVKAEAAAPKAEADVTAKATEAAEAVTQKVEATKVDAAATAEPVSSGAAKPRDAAAYYGEGPAPPYRSDVKKLVNKIVDSEREALTAEYTAKLVKPGEELYDPSWVKRLPAKVDPVPEDLTEEQIADVRVPMPFSTTGGRLYGLSEPKKTWFTPWSPRQFLAPFAILPHHIEIDFRTCHAVYLRDPVARPGHSEVISPFNLDMHERAYLWYIYRRRKNLPKLHIN